MSKRPDVATNRSVPTTVSMFVLRNADETDLAAAAIEIPVDEKIASLRSKFPNSGEAESSRDDTLNDFLILKIKVEALRTTAALFVSGTADEQPDFESSNLFADEIAAWWAKYHLQICSKDCDIALFATAPGLCSLVGCGGALSATVSGALVGGKPMVEAIKAAAPKSGLSSS